MCPRSSVKFLSHSADIHKPRLQCPSCVQRSLQEKSRDELYTICPELDKENAYEANLGFVGFLKPAAPKPGALL